MKKTIFLALTLLPGLAGAAEFADLQNTDSAAIARVNPYPNPSNPDSCYLASFKDGLCNFRCRSGETFQIKPVKPEADSLYVKCGAGDYRGAAETRVNPFPTSNPDSCYLTGLKEGLCHFRCRDGGTFQVKPVKPEASSLYEKCGAADYRGAAGTRGAQTYESYGKYPTAAKASEVMTWALNGFKFAKTQVTGQTIVVHGLSDYRFRISYNAASPLAVETSPVYRAELDAYERMFDMADRLENEGATVVTHEVASYEGGYYYAIGYFPGTRGADRSADKALKVCWLKTMEKDACVYKCKDGSTYTQPMQRPNPWEQDQNVVPCPQLVFPF